MTKINMAKIESFINFLKNQKGVGIFLLSLAVFFNVIFLWSEIAIPTVNLNDEVLHLTAIQEASMILRQNLNLTDFWLSQIGLGFPLFHHYQHLPHTVLVVIDQLTSSFLSLPQLLDVSRYLLLVFFPVSIFLAMRRFGFDSLASGFSALVASLLSTNALYGLDYGSYIWRGSGLYTQLWAMFFLPLALAEIYQVITGKNRFFGAVFFSVIVLLSNLFYGYILVLSSIPLVFLRFKKEEIFHRLKRLSLIFLLVGLATSYFWIPFLLDRTYVNRSIWEESFKYDSFGIFKVLGDLVAGRLLDYGRIIPVLTIFFSLSTLLLFLKRSKERYRILLWLTVFWLALYFGRPTWGKFLDILPFSQYLHLHRFIGGFHLAAIMSIGAGVSLVFKWIQKKSSRLVILLAVIIVVMLSPAYIERIEFYTKNAQWRLENQNAFSLVKDELLDIGNTLKNLPPGRIYAGLPSNWGNYPYYRIGSVPLYAIFPQLGLDSLGYAYHSEAFSDDIRLHFDDTNLAQYNLFNVRYVLLHNTWSPAYYYSEIKKFSSYTLYEIPTTGYFDLVDAPAVFYGKGSDFYYPNSKWLFSSLPELKQHPIIEITEEPEKTFGLPVFSFKRIDEKILSDLALEQSERGEIFNERVEANKYWVQFGVERDSYLVLKANYHPGWQVYLDQEEVKPVMLAPGFIGIRVQPGVHQALFTYRAPVWRFPLLMLGILSLGLIFFGPLKISEMKKTTMKRLRGL